MKNICKGCAFNATSCALKSYVKAAGGSECSKFVPEPRTKKATKERRHVLSWGTGDGRVVKTVFESNGTVRQTTRKKR